MAARALGLAAAADAQLAEPAPRRSLRRPRSRRLHDERRGRRADRPLRRARSRSGPDRHERHLACGAPTTATRSRRATARSSRARWSSRAEPATCRAVPGFAHARAAGRRAADAVRLPQPGPAPRRRRARRGRVGHRRAAGGRAEAIGPAGDPLGRRARAAAANVSRPRRPVVDGRVRRVGPAATTRSTISRARGGCRRRSSSERPSERRSTSTR